MSDTTWHDSVAEGSKLAVCPKETRDELALSVSGRALTVGAAQRSGAARLSQAGSAAALRDSRRLLAAAMGCEPQAVMLHPERVLTDDVANVFAGFIARRLAHEPVTRIIGQRDFADVTLQVTPAVLDPRPDTETVVDVARHLAGAGIIPPMARIADLGTGSGALAIALLTLLSEARALAVDLSSEALMVAGANARANGVADRLDLSVGSWLDDVDDAFDLIVSNPPYIRTGDLATLAPEVAVYDPAIALDGGEDGLDAYRALAPQVAARLSSSGVAVLEVGAGQADDVAAIVSHAGLIAVAQHSERLKDLAGHTRVVVCSHTTVGVEIRKHLE